MWKVEKHRATLTYRLNDIGEVTIGVDLKSLVDREKAQGFQENLAARQAQYLLSNLSSELSRQLA